MADEGTDAIRNNDADIRQAAETPQEREQPDPALQMSTGRIGATGLVVFAVIAGFILTVVLYGLNGPSETQAPAGKAPAAATAPNTSPAPTPTAPENGPGAKP